jgi:hypothetical protein
MTRIAKEQKSIEELQTLRDRYLDCIEEANQRLEANDKRQSEQSLEKLHREIRSVYADSQPVDYKGRSRVAVYLGLLWLAAEAARAISVELGAEEESPEEKEVANELTDNAPVYPA